MVLSTWRDAIGVVADIREALRETLAGISSPWTQWRERSLSEVVSHAVAMARLTQADGLQRAIEHPAGSLDELKSLRLEVRDAIRAAPSPVAPDVTPWLWNQASTDGVPLTEAGRMVGYELRLSRSRTAGATAR